MCGSGTCVRLRQHVICAFLCLTRPIPRRYHEKRGSRACFNDELDSQTAGACGCNTCTSNTRRYPPTSFWCSSTLLQGLIVFLFFLNGTRHVTRVFHHFRLS